MSLSARARSAPRQNTSSRRLRSGMGEQDGGHFSVIRTVVCTPLTGKALSAARQTPKWISFTCMTWQVFLSANRNLQLCPLRPVICAREALALVSLIRHASRDTIRIVLSVTSLVVVSAAGGSAAAIRFHFRAFLWLCTQPRFLC